jgi:TP901 family phage tail tape measure protein
MDISGAAQQAAMSGNMSQSAAREVSVLLDANTGPYQQEMGKAAKATEGLADALHKVENAYKGVLRIMGGAAIGLGASMQATATASLWSAAQFEESFARVAKTTGLQNTFRGQTGRGADFAASFGIGDSELQDFENSIRSLSTEIPVATQELSYLADVAGSLGVKGNESLTLFAKTAAQLGAGINNLSSDQAIAGLANLMGAFGDADASVVRLGSSLADLANHTRGEASDMLSFGDRIAGTAKQVGMASEEVLGWGAAISAIGVMPELGASAMTQVITEMSRAVQRGGTDLENFAKSMGMSAEAMTEAWSDPDRGPSAVLMQFVDSLASQGEAATLTLQRLGLNGINVSQVFGGLAAQADVLHEALDISDTAYDAGEAVEQLAEIRFDTLVNAITQFRQATAEVFRSMGIGFLPIIKGMVDGVTSLVNVFNALPQPIKTTMGLILGFGGAVLIAGGMFLMFFAQFHAIFMLLHVLPMLLAKAATAMTAMGGSAVVAAGHANRLSVALTTLTGILTNLPGAAGAAFLAVRARLAMLVAMFVTASTAAMTFAKTTGGAMVAALGKAIPAAATAATAGLVKFRKALQAATLWAGRFIAAEVWIGLKMTGAAASAAAAKFSPLLLVAGKFLLIAAAIAGVVYGIGRAFGVWKKETEEITGALNELATAMRMNYANVDDLTHDFSSNAEFEVKVATSGAELIEFLKTLDDAQAEEYLFRYGLDLIQQGNKPEEVKRLIEELGRLSENPIVFEWAMEQLKSGDGFEAVMAAAGSSVGDMITKHLHDEDTDKITRSKVSLVSAPKKQFQEDFKESLNILKATAGNNDAAKLALLVQTQQDLQEAFDTDKISRDVLNWANNELEQQLGMDTSNQDTWIEASMGGPVEWTRRALAGFIPGLNESSAGGHDLDPAKQIKAFMGEEGFADTEIYTKMSAAIREVTGHTGDLNEAIDSLTPDQLSDVVTELEAVALELQNTATEPLEIEFSTNLGQVLAEAANEFEEPEDYKRFQDHLFETYPQQVGYVQALREADVELQKLVDTGKGWGEDAERYRKAIQSWGEEFAKLRVDDIMVKVNTLEATDQVRALKRELDTLDMNETYNVTIAIELRQNLQASLSQAEGEFRSVMGQYDQLIDQREESIRSHHERLEKMEEDHGKRTVKMREDHVKNIAKMEANQAKQISKAGENYAKQVAKSEENYTKQIAKAGESHTKQLLKMEEQRDKTIRNARESHVKRLEDINKSEQKAIEGRIEAMASAFNIMERIQAKPSTSIGSLQQNMAAQNAAMQEMTANKEKLRQMGLSSDVMKELNFDDPTNFAAVRRLLETALSDPTIINDVNALWKDRLKLAEAFVDSDARNEITKQFDEQREAAKEGLAEQIQDIKDNHAEQRKEAKKNQAERLDEMKANNAERREEMAANYAEQLSDMRANHAEQIAETKKGFSERLKETNESYAESIKTANADHARQLESIAKALGKLGKTSLETIEELQEKALASGLSKLEDWAKEIKALQDEVAGIMGTGNRGNDHSGLQQAPLRMREGMDVSKALKDAKNAGQSTIVAFSGGWQDSAPALWREIERSMEVGSASSTKTSTGVFADGVKTTFTTLDELTRQDRVWNPTSRQAEQGAKGTTKRVTDEFTAGVDTSFTILDGLTRQGGVWDPTSKEASTGAKRVTDSMTTELEKGTGRVGKIMGDWGKAIEGGVNPVLKAIGQPTIKISASGGRGSGSDRRFTAADGDILPNQAKIQSPGTLVQWAEPETGGEAFIPLASSKRQRSVAIWKETGALLGQEVESFAKGGLRAPNSDAASGGRYGGWTANLAPYVIHDVARILNATPGGQQITSAYRSPEHNRSVGGAKNSDHMQGHAVDIGPLGANLDAAIRAFQGLAGVRWVSPPGTYTSHRHVSWKNRGFTPDHGNVTHNTPDGIGTAGEGGYGPMFTMPEIPTMPEGLLGEAGTAVMNHVAGKIQTWADENLFSGGEFGSGAIPQGELQDMVKKRMLAKGFGPEQWNPLARLIQNESSWNPNAQNPGSTAFGLYQFLDSTWSGTGIAKSSDPGVQTEAGLRYITNRYGTPAKALAFWNRKVPINGKNVGHWYADGGQLTDDMKRGTDQVPAMLTHGEYVMNPGAVGEYGTEMLDAINSKKFARGGRVGTFPSSKGREPMSSGQPDLVGALTKALEHASYGSSETNTWNVKVQANDTKTMIRELEAKERLSRLTRGNQHGR